MNLASKQLFISGKYGDRQTYYQEVTEQLAIVRKSGNRDLLVRALADKSLSKVTRFAIQTRIQILS